MSCRRGRRRRKSATAVLILLIQAGWTIDVAKAHSNAVAKRSEREQTFVMILDSAVHAEHLETENAYREKHLVHAPSAATGTPAYRQTPWRFAASP